MGKQLEMFPPPPPSADDELNAAQAEMRLSRMARDAAARDEPTTRDERRSRRRRPVRAATISIRRLPKRELELGRQLFPPEEHADVQRPRTRDECRYGVRPCPFVSCEHHLYLDASAKSGAIKLNFPDLEPWELDESCALDVAERGGATLEDVGAIMNLTRERIRQIEVKALAKCEAAIEMRGFRELGDGRPRRRLPVLEQRDDDDAPAFDVDHFAGDELDEG